MGLTEREVDELRWANKMLTADVNAVDRFKSTISKAIATTQAMAQRTMSAMEATDATLLHAPLQQPQVPAISIDTGTHGPLAELPLAPSGAAVPLYSPTRPMFTPATKQPKQTRGSSP